MRQRLGLKEEVEDILGKLVEENTMLSETLEALETLWHLTPYLDVNDVETLSALKAYLDTNDTIQLHKVALELCVKTLSATVSRILGEPASLSHCPKPPLASQLSTILSDERRLNVARIAVRACRARGLDAASCLEKVAKVTDHLAKLGEILGLEAVEKAATLALSSSRPLESLEKIIGVLEKGGVETLVTRLLASAESLETLADWAVKATRMVETLRLAGYRLTAIETAIVERIVRGEHRLTEIVDSIVGELGVEKAVVLEAIYRLSKIGLVDCYVK